MNKQEVCIIKVYSYLTKTENILGKVYKNWNDAVEYCYRQLTIQEQEKTRNLQKRGLLTKNEFLSKDYLYNISELDLV